MNSKHYDLLHAAYTSAGNACLLDIKDAQKEWLLRGNRDLLVQYTYQMIADEMPDTLEKLYPEENPPPKQKVQEESQAKKDEEIQQGSFRMMPRYVEFALYTAAKLTAKAMEYSWHPIYTLQCELPSRFERLMSGSAVSPFGS